MAAAASPTLSSTTFEPFCDNLCGKEGSLRCGKPGEEGTRVCSSNYCSRECQKAHWFMHKYVCSASPLGLKYPSVDLSTITALSFCAKTSCPNALSGKVELCACKRFAYCSKKCQTADKKEHVSTGFCSFIQKQPDLAEPFITALLEVEAVLDASAAAAYNSLKLFENPELTPENRAGIYIHMYQVGGQYFQKALELIHSSQEARSQTVLDEKIDRNITPKISATTIKILDSIKLSQSHLLYMTAQRAYPCILLAPPGDSQLASKILQIASYLKKISTFSQGLQLDIQKFLFDLFKKLITLEIKRGNFEAANLHIAEIESLAAAMPDSEQTEARRQLDILKIAIQIQQSFGFGIAANP